jgi:hypothetical protein
MDKFVLIEKDNVEQILDVKGVYTYKEALDILEKGHKELGGELYVPEGNHEWALEWHYGDYNGTYWVIIPIDTKFKYPEYLE